MADKCELISAKQYCLLRLIRKRPKIDISLFSAE